MNNISTQSLELYKQGRDLVKEICEAIERPTIGDVWDVIIALVRLAEEVITIEGQGQLKSEIVMNLWRIANSEYFLSKRFDEAIVEQIKFPRYLGWLGKIIRSIDFDGLIEKWIIPVIVKMANRLGWGK